MKLSPSQRDAMRTMLYAQDRNGGSVPDWVLDKIDPRTIRALRQKGLMCGSRLTEPARRRAKAIDKAWRKKQRGATP